MDEPGRKPPVPEAASFDPAGLSPSRRRPAPEGVVQARETGGPPGPEPTRFGDWERGGRCIDF